jgi:hypothetical protein
VDCHPEQSEGSDRGAEIRLRDVKRDSMPAQERAADTQDETFSMKGKIGGKFQIKLSAEKSG